MIPYYKVPVSLFEYALLKLTVSSNGKCQRSMNNYNFKKRYTSRYNLHFRFKCVLDNPD